ncbi:hypothetical protein F5Y06DRAFT_280848 [Hypoxylon sp. FL0890]|nr:hypothetical protein F5Y06DRAFT_280848 [Hypoxylon sp. FL0890]
MPRNSLLAALAIVYLIAVSNAAPIPDHETISKRDMAPGYTGAIIALSICGTVAIIMTARCCWLYCCGCCRHYD